MLRLRTAVLFLLLFPVLIVIDLFATLAEALTQPDQRGVED